MNVFLAAIIKIVLAEALIALLVASYFFEKSARARRWFGACFLSVALLSGAAYFNWFSFRGGRQGLIHAHEQYHFYLGSQYLDELRYDNLYRASVVALQEDPEGIAWARSGIGRHRLLDPMTFQTQTAQTALEAGDAIRGRFSDDRWAAFRDDVRFFFGELRLGPSVLRDHGNTGSPIWAVVATVAAPFGLSRATATGYALLDPLLLLILFGTLWRLSDPRVACVALSVGLISVSAYAWIGGSLLRLDWLFAVGMAFALFDAGRFKTAGAFLGYAVATKLFCGLIALAVGLRFVWATARDRRLHRHHVQVVAAAFATLALCVIVAAAWFGGFDIWTEYAERILVTFHERYYAFNYSFRDLFLQQATAPTLAMVPEPIAAALPAIDIADHTASFVIARLLVGVAFLLVLARHEEWFGFGLGVLFIWLVLVTNIYYWLMMMLFAGVCARGYREDPRKLAYLVGTLIFLMASWYFVHLSKLKMAKGYFGSYWIGLLCLLIFAVELGGWLRDRRARERAPGGAEQLSLPL